MSKPHELMTTGEVAERLNIGVDTVRRLIAAGRLPGVKIGGRAKVARAAVDVLVAKAGEVSNAVSRAEDLADLEAFETTVTKDASPALAMDAGIERGR